MKRAVLGFLALLACLAMVIGMVACNRTAQPSAASGAAVATAAAKVYVDPNAPPPQDPFGTYSPAITVTTIHAGMNDSFWFPKGDDINKNIYTRTYHDRLGIDYKFLWTCPSSQRSEKINVMIASDQLPDVFNIDKANFDKLQKAGKLADITSAVQNYATKYSKKYLSGLYQPLLDMGVRDGKIYGLAAGAFAYTDSAEMIWIRADWLKKLGLAVPTTFSDLVKVMDAFVKNDPDGNGKADTYAFGSAGVNMGTDVYFMGMYASFFNMFHVYPNQSGAFTWVKGSGGNLEDGMFGPSFRNNTKTALSTLRDWYSKGYLCRDFATYDDTKYQQDLANAKFGIEFGGIWDAYWPLILCLDTDPKADWVPIPVPSADGKPVYTNNYIADTGSLNVASARCAHPEALVKMENLYHDLNNNPETNTEFGRYNTDPKDNNVICQAFPMMVFNPSWNYEGYLAIQEARSTGDTSKLPPAYKQFYDQLEAYLKTGDKSGWCVYRSYTDDGCYGVIKQYMARKQYMFNEFAGQSPTPAMVDNWPSVKKIYDQMFFNVVMKGETSQYNSFVSQYDSLYGKQASKEVNDWFTANGRKSVQDWYQSQK